jgi:hypothetical protein
MTQEKNLPPWATIPAEDFPRDYHEGFIQIDLMIGDMEKQKQKDAPRWRVILGKIFFFLPIRLQFTRWVRKRKRVWVPAIEINQDSPLELLNEQELAEELEGK